ncbi:MAG: 50S ribosomal protein L29 [Candidatus Micrarchaeota archaeon]|nr:50S ribosomal protein L29 [Candidatus Micrarchaeota archaeon]MDE1850891.1 50S ribosomal protein L29 [Candidatus Micrarchaeota archaeon]
MHIKDLRSLAPEALKAKLAEVRFELGIERRKIASTGVASKKIKSREMKRTIAQILTLLKEKGVAE